MTTSMDEWKDIDWKTVERNTFKLQKRVYQAAKNGDTKKLHKLQRLILSSHHARLLAVRRVTQDNQGKKTAGIDGQTALNPKSRLELVEHLKLNEKTTPLRRVYIPKSNGESRPLGIPTIKERAKQALAKLALEPEWEAQFEANSYGFRPGRGCHDAIDAIRNSIKYREGYVLDADIAGCFDNINHDYLMDKLNAIAPIKKQIRVWLKSGYMEGKELFPTTSGTPQGGVISPLLANIALHGLEEYIVSQYPKRLPRSQGRKYWNPNLIRYADDFVVIHPSEEVVKEIQAKITEWLKPIGLELKPSKTSIISTWEGFDFLGFSISHIKPGVNKRGFQKIPTLKEKVRLNHVTLIKPSQESFRKYKQKLKEIVRQHKSNSQSALIGRLNPVITGWCNYFKYGACWQIFGKADYYMWQLLRRWGLRQTRKSARHTKNKYWKKSEFTDGKYTLKKHYSFCKEIHAKVRDVKSPFDGDWVYWGNRMKKYPGLSSTQAFLLKRQQSKCNSCHLRFKTDDLLEVHHIDGNHNNNQSKNLELLHRHCHDSKHGSTHDKG